MKRLRNLAIAGVVLIVGLLVLAFTFITPERWRPEIERQLTEDFGRRVHLGSMRYTLLNGFGVEVADIVIEGSPEFGEQTFASVDRIWIDVGVIDLLFRRRFSVDRLVVDRPHIGLVKREDGVWNWTSLGAGRPQSAASGGSPPLAVAGAFWIGGDAMRLAPDRLDVRSAEVSVVNRSANPPTEYVYKNVTLGARIAADGERLKVEGRIEADSAAEGGEPLLADLPFEAVLTPPTADIAGWQAEGRVDMGKFATRNVRVAGVKTGFLLEASTRLSLPDLKAALFDGVFDGQFSLDLATPDYRFDLNGRFGAISLGDALRPLPDLAASVHGKAGGTFEGSGELGDFASTIASLKGKGRLTVAEAELTTFNVLAEVAKQGGFSASEFSEQGTAAESVEATFTMENDRMTFDRAEIRSVNGYADLRVDSGWLDLGSPVSINLDGAATLLPPLIRKIRESNPTTALVLGSLGEGPVTVPLTVEGPLTKPRVVVRWGAILHLPFGL